MGGRSGQLAVYDLSRMAMKFARVMCGSREARVGGSISPKNNNNNFSVLLDLHENINT